MADKINRLILELIVDKASLANAKTELNSVRAQMASFATDAKKADLATVATGKSIRDAFSSQTSARIASFQGKMADAVTSTKGLTAALTETQQATGFLGKLQSVQSKAAFFGRELKALPAVQLSGNLSSDAVGKLTQVFGRLPPAALGAGAALAVVAVALKAATDASAAQAEAQKRSNEIQAQVTRDIITNTKEGLRAQLEAAKIETQVQTSLLNQRVAILAEMEEREKAATAIFGREVAVGIQALGIYGGDIKQQREDIIATGKALLDASETQRAYEDALNSNATATNDAAEAEKRLTAARDAALERQISNETEAAGLRRSGSSKQVDDRIKALLDENDAIVRVIASGEASEAELLKLSERLEVNNEKLAELQDNVQQYVIAREAEAAALEKEKQIREDSIKAVEKYNEDLLRLEEQLNERRAAIEEQYGEKLVQIAERAAEAAENALSKLQEKRNDVAQDIARDAEDAQREAQRDELDAQIEFQQEEAKAARDHARSLAEIRRRAAEQEEDLALNRDFAGLFQLRRDTNRQIEEANSAYAEQRAERIIAFQQEAEDRRRAFAQDAEDRNIKYQRELADAQAQYVRELRLAQAAQLKATQQAQVAYQRDLQLAQQKYVTEVQLRQQAIRAELQTIQQGEQAKLQLEAQYWQQALNLARSAIAAIGGQSFKEGGGGSKGRATGGLVAAMQSYNVNEPGISSGRESFSGKNGTVMLPGAGLFTPLSPGRVNANGGGPNVTLQFNVTGGADPEATARAVDARVENTLRRIFMPSKGAA